MGYSRNIHVAQSLTAQAELKFLASSKNNIISAQSSKPNVGIVQDSLLGAYRMTLNTQKLTKSQFYNIAIKLELTDEQIQEKLRVMQIVYKKMGRKAPLYTGHGLVSLILPDTLIYEKKNCANPKEPVVKIYRGIMYEGTLDKNVVGARHNSLIQVIHKEYGKDAASDFIDHIQFATNNWLLVSGFSIGLGDCLIKGEGKDDAEKKKQEIKDYVHKCFMEAEAIKTTTTHSGIREMRVNATLNKAKDVGLRIAKESMAKDNSFLSTVTSGSKGDFVNIAQVSGLLGQQNLKGQRIPLMMNHGRRSLVHYPFEDLTPEMEYESRGFITSSFKEGLNPREFYFHAMSGREGVCDTAMGTATSGYMQRRIVKLTEDIKTQHDGSVRDAVGRIYQSSYGGNGIDPTCTVKVNGNQEICDVSRMVARLNLEHELTENTDM